MHAQVGAFAHREGTSKQYTSSNPHPKKDSVTQTCISELLQASQLFTLRQAEALTQLPAQHVPEMAGTSPAGHAGGCSRQRITDGSHSTSQVLPSCLGVSDEAEHAVTHAKARIDDAASSVACEPSRGRDAQPAWIRWLAIDFTSTLSARPSRSRVGRRCWRGR
jgi:hypothetical protein